MRNRLGAAITAGLVLVAGLTGVALAATETVADDFGSGGYGGSTGTMEWTGNWVEVGESNGPGSGAVRVQAEGNCASGQCLTINQLLGGLSSIGAMRSLDLSEATSASLTYHIDFPGGLLLDGSAVVEARADGGAWNQLRSHNAGTADSFTADLPVGHIVDIRLRAAELALTASMAFDDVSVEVDLPDPTTTSTTTTTTAPTSSSSTPTSSTTTSTTATPTTATPATPTTTEQADDGPTSADPPADEPTTTVDRAHDDTETTTTTSEPSAVGETPTTTERGEDGEATVPTTPSTTIPGTNTPEPEDGSKSASVVTDLDPRLRSVGGLRAQEDLLVVFGQAVEDIALDLLASAVLGLVLAWASLRRLG